MNKNNYRPFEEAKIEIVEVLLCDIITASPTGPGAFPGEEDEFDTYYWDQH